MFHNVWAKHHVLGTDTMHYISNLQFKLKFKMYIWILMLKFHFIHTLFFCYK